MPPLGGPTIRRIIATASLATIALVLLAIIVGCVPWGQESAYWPTEEWRTFAPEEQDMDPAQIQQMMDLIDEQGFAYDSVLVVRHGTIVFEEYRNGYDRDTRHHLQSATKSYSSMLIGIAIQEGFLESVDQKLVDLLPGYTPANLDARKQRLTLEHLLTMSDGMVWHELDYPYTDARNTLGQMWSSRDAIQHVLDQPMAREPGEAWAYNSGTSILLGGILEQATGQDVLAFAREYLFGPLGIEDLIWSKTTGNHYHTDGGLYLTPRDMARFGYLMLHDGTWNGKELVSTEWVARSTETHHQTGMGKGYGYQWWTLTRGVFAAMGHYEQKIYVVPETDMVVVFTGNIPDDVLSPTDGLLYGYILSACTDLPPEAARETYVGHGFTFDYPGGYSVHEMPLPVQDSVPEPQAVQFLFASYPLELIQVFWLPTQSSPDLEAYLSGFVASASQQAGVEFVKGESRAFFKDGHQAISQSFQFARQGIQLKCVNTVWFCPESQQVYIFSYGTSLEVSDPDMWAQLQEHLDSFGCHAPD